MSFRISLIVTILLAIVTAAPAAVRPDPDRIVVLISVDGLGAFYLDDPKAEMPNIRALAAQGASASGMKASVPTVTWPNHTTLVTGDNPARHGVVGNNYFDRATGKPVTLISDPIYDKDQIVKTPTIYDIAKSAGLRTAAIRWPATRNARSLDWTIPDVGREKLLNKYWTPELRAECIEAGLWKEPPPSTQPETQGIRGASDEFWTDAFNLILKKHRPNVALLHIAHVDSVQHRDGPKSPEAYVAIKEADQQVGRVWEMLKQEYPGRATLIVVSDHGFSPINKIVLPNVILRNAGIIEVKGPRVVGGAVRVVPQGGCAMIYIQPGQDRADVVNRVTKAFEGVEGVAKVVPPEGLAAYGVGDPKLDPHAPDMLLFADYGYSFGDTAAGALSFNEKPERKGSHGHDPNLPQLHATFVMWGAGVIPGTKLGEIENTSVAPTMARLLDLQMPNTDGKPLSAALK